MNFGRILEVKGPSIAYDKSRFLQSVSFQSPGRGPKVVSDRTENASQVDAESQMVLF